MSSSTVNYINNLFDSGCIGNKQCTATMQISDVMDNNCLTEISRKISDANYYNYTLPPQIYAQVDCELGNIPFANLAEGIERTSLGAVLSGLDLLVVLIFILSLPL